MIATTLPPLNPLGTWEIEPAVHNLEDNSGLLQSDVIPNVEEKPNQPTARQTETALVQELRKREEAAFSTLIDRYQGKLLRLARSFVPSEAVAEEVVQETWMAVLEGIHRFEGRSSLKTWIFQILINRAKTKGQRESRYKSLSPTGVWAEEEWDFSSDQDHIHSTGPENGHWTIPSTTWEGHTPERVLLSKEGLTKIERAIESLPLMQRQVLTLRDVEGIDSHEVCRILQLTPTNQRVVLHRARSKVRLLLNDYLQESTTRTRR